MTQLNLNQRKVKIKRVRETLTELQQPSESFTRGALALTQLWPILSDGIYRKI